MEKQNRKTIFTTIAIDKETDKIIEKLCKRYSLKKGEITKLAFQYLDKANINPSEAPESTKAELRKINKRQDDLIRFIRHYEEEQLNPMIRTSNSIAVKFDVIAKTISEKLDSEIANSKDTLVNVLRKLDEQFGKVADVVTNHSKVINSLSQVQQRDSKRLLKLISLYSELSACGVMDGKRKENLKSEIIDLINETK
ncbi:BfmA/BtgA family mobilization protein [Dysgonomonas sp. ZJ279]|uniref:BfmA/BtgA family mobilization protein n=1 Tax=Dysgonomonas sp. ZJ279 TaxID=2709796 RepID=UPI0013EB202E|nr:BfmA/BtgA family mobilization protein [Dysgonomonas sp. ZJ279]